MLVLGAVGVVLWLGMAFWGATRVQVAATGIDDGRALTPEVASDLDITIALDSSDELFRSNLKVDGVPLLDDLEPEADGRSVRIRPADLVETELVEQALAEGEHTIELSVARMFLGDSTFKWTYVVDSIAPTLDLPTNLDPVPIADPVSVTGTVEEGAELRFGGEALDVDDGSFAVDVRHPSHWCPPVHGRRRSGQHHDRARRGARHLPGQLACRPRQRRGLGQRRAPRRRHGPDRSRA